MSKSIPTNNEKSNTKLPSFQFYPADWRKDPAVQALDFFDRGIWHEILCLMHESDQRGLLLLNGKAMPNEALARLLGLDNQILTTTLTKLLEYGVASVDEETGALMSRRMVRDEKLRQTRTEAGKLGGNPNLVNQKSTTQVNQKSTTQVNQKSTPSSSSSSSDKRKNTSYSKEAAAKKFSTEKKPKTDVEIIEKYSAMEKYSHCDVPHQFKRMLKWCAENKEQPSERRFQKWLDRTEQPLEITTAENAVQPHPRPRNEAELEQVYAEIRTLTPEQIAARYGVTHVPDFRYDPINRFYRNPTTSEVLR